MMGENREKAKVSVGGWGQKPSPNLRRSAATFTPPPLPFLKMTAGWGGKGASGEGGEGKFQKLF